VSRVRKAVVGLGWGDEGKGTTIDFLAREFTRPRIGRFSGGAQALHHVHLPDGTVHGFHQFTAGTFAGCRTELGPGVVIDPGGMNIEASELEEKGIRNPAGLITVDPKCLVTTPWHRKLNQLTELSRGKDRHGTTGMGVGEAIQDAEKNDCVLRAKHLAAGNDVDERLMIIQKRMIKAAELLGYRPKENDVRWLSGLYRMWAEEFRVAPTNWAHNPPDLLEGSQGALIDPDYGFFPYVTKTPVVAEAARDATPGTDLDVIGVMRAYSTRHGRGPFVTEDKDFPVSGSENNQTNDWQEGFRVGPLDLVAAKYAAAVSGSIRGLAVTCLDRVSYPFNVCTSYLFTADHKAWANILETNFIMESEGRITGIRPLDPTFISSWRTGALKHCVPLLGVKVHNENQLLDLIEKELDLPVIITSSGPTHKDKEWRLSVK